MSKRFLVGCIAATMVAVPGVAFAAKAESSWERFAEFGSTNNGTHRCAAQMATILTADPPVEYEPAAYGDVRFRDGTNCGSPRTADSGWLGAMVLATRADGTICGSKSWTYNSAPTPQHSVGTLWSCPHSSIRAVVRGRVWQSSTNSYITSDFYTESPWLN